MLGVGYLLGKQLKAELISYLNENLLVQMKVEQIHFTGIEHFPNIGVTLKNVRLNESFPAFNSSLVSAASIEILVNPFALLKNQIDVRKLVVNHATFRIYNGAEGNTNYDVLRASSGDSSRFRINFNNLLFSNCRLIYLDEKELVSCNTMLYKLRAKGQVTDHGLDLNLSFNGLFDHFRLGPERFLVGKHASWRSDLQVNTKLQSFHIESAELGMEDLLMKMNGDILMLNRIPDLDLEFSAPELQVQGIISLLPNSIRDNLGEWQTEGKWSLFGSIKGQIQNDELPIVKAKLNVHEGEVRGHYGNFRNINFSAALENSNRSNVFSGEMELSSLSFGESELSLSFQSMDLSKYIRIESSTLNLYLKDLERFNQELEQFELSGLLNLSVAGDLEYSVGFTPNTRGSILITNGKMSSSMFPSPMLADLEAVINGVDLVEVKTEVQFDGDQVLLEGRLNNFIGFWGSGRPSWIGHLTANTVHLSDFFDDADTGSSDNSEVDLDLGFDINTDLQIAELIWNKVSLKNLSGNLSYGSDNFTITDAHYSAWQGNHTLSLILIEEENYYKLLAKGLSKNADLAGLFTEFENFDQTEITSENLSGQLTTDFDVSVLFDADFNLVEREVYCSGDVAIKNGRLKGYKPLEELSLFLDLEDLKNIQFEDLENRLEIRNGIIYLPETELKNSALNLSVSGSHTLDNYMDYHVKVKVTEVLAKRSKWVEKKNEKRLEEGRDGGITAYVKMSGTPDELRIMYDSKTAAKEFRKNFKEERKSFFKEVGKEIRGEQTSTPDKNKPVWIE